MLGSWPILTLCARVARAHKAGDHSLCRPGCGKNRRVAAAPVSLAAVRGGSAGNLDPRRAMTGLALRLEAAHEADPSNAAIARELRVTLLALGGQTRRPEDAVDRIRAEYDEVMRGL
jgi:hypothetical protein